MSTLTTFHTRNKVALENEQSRVDAVAKVTGAAKFTYDINLPNMAIAQLIRAPYVDARVVGANLAAARGIKGVLDVALYMKPEGRARSSNMVPTDNLADVRVGQYAGQVVGHVCAENLHLAEDAVAALGLKWEHGKPKTNLRRLARKMKQPRKDADKAKLPEIEKMFAGAAHVVEATYETQMQHHVSLETHGAVVDYQGTKAVIYGSTQGTYSFRDGLARDLDLDKKDLEMNCQYVGGGFGSKFGPGVEGKLAARMSKKFGRPVKVMNSRKDESRDTGLRPGSRQYYKLACDDSGLVLGGRFHSWSSVGARRGGGACRPVPYRFTGGDLYVATQDEIMLSHCPARPQRAPGYPQASFPLEGMLDELADKVGMDPIEFRKLNDPRPTRHAMYDRGMPEIGWERRKASGTWPGVAKRGFGVGAAQWHNNGHATSSAEIRIYPDGKVETRMGIQDIGNGNRTFLVDLTASSMGLDRRFVTGLLGSTIYPFGPASGGSVVARSVAPPIMAAAEKAKLKVIDLAAKELGEAADSLDLKGDAIVAKADGAKKMSWEDACRLIAEDHLTLIGEWDDRFHGKGESDGVALAEVEVDTETGVVRLIKLVVIQQCGVPVNRKIVESQIMGGAIQGISYTLFENRIINVENGAMVNANMESYKIAGTADMPEIVPIIDVPDGTTGVRALGEPPIIGVPAAIGNAVANALGARVFSLPITPDKVLAALRAKGGTA